MGKRIKAFLLVLSMSLIIPVAQVISVLILYIGIFINLLISEADFDISYFLEITQNNMADYLGDIVMYASIISYVITAVIVVLIMHAFKIYLKDEKMLRKINYKILVLPFIAAIGCYMFQILTTSFFADLFTNSVNEYSAITDLIFSNTNMFLLIFTIGILGPIVEELVFRGLIFNYLKRHYAVWAALILQALLFGFMHLNLFQFSYAFLMGIVIGLIYIRTKSLWAPIIVHITNNLIAILLSQFVINEESISILIIPAGLLIAIISFIFMGDRKKLITKG